ncbi:pathway-specific nitrogen regulator [Diplocarpon rosae]|nr:pathway-specific nitrogen regulator [Diplocarpon rosae]
MRNTATPVDFEIHVDPSCLSDESSKTDHTPDLAEQAITQEDEPAAERVSSNQTVVHHGSWEEKDTPIKSPVEDQDAKAEDEHKENTPAPASPRKATVEDAADEEKLQEPQPEQNAEDQAERERQIERIQAQIHAAARAVVASIEKDHYNGAQETELTSQTKESCDQEGTETTHDGTALSDEEGMELTYGDDAKATNQTEDEQHSTHEDEAYESDRQNGRANGDASDHHDADIDDDIFSYSDHSKRSSMNSDIHSSDDNQKMLTSPVVGEEAGSANEGEAVSRIPSASSYMQMPTGSTPRTPSKVLSRPPFRTPSSVRAMQMSSPTQSVFSAPRSSKRYMPTVSRIGTPNSQYSPSKRTPIRFKEKKEPLVLLHVTVLPLQWPYSHLMSSPEVPTSLQTVKESWRLLQEKLGDTVLERGILLPHPQDSYEVLEERLLEALELPVHPRAKILKCGHYMGPSDSESPSSDEEAGDDTWGTEAKEERKWCEICRRDMRLETVGDVGQGERRFRVKVYASNGLMRAGAWAACWREMERVDVELEPYLESHMSSELEHLALVVRPDTEGQGELDDGFVDEDTTVEHVHDPEAERRREEEERLHEEEARLRDEETRLHEEEQMRKQRALEEELRQRMVEEEEMMRKNLEEQRMHEIYSQEPLMPRNSRRNSSRIAVHDNSSLLELLLAAFKVAMRDSKNVAIAVLSMFILLLALRPKSVPEPTHSTVVMDAAPQSQVTTTVFKEIPVTVAAPVSRELPVAKAAPGPMVEQVAPVVAKHMEREPVTTTIFREFTVTERIPIATSVDRTDSPPQVLEPCDPSPIAGEPRNPVEDPQVLLPLKSDETISSPVEPSLPLEIEAESLDSTADLDSMIAPDSSS